MGERRRRAVVATAAAAATLSVAVLLTASPSQALPTHRAVGGVPDPTFGSDGRVVTGVGTLAQADAVALQGRKPVTAGFRLDATASSDWVVVRYRPDGRVDRTFGTRGRRVVDLGGVEHAHDVLVLPNGKLVVVGSATSPLSGTFGVVRLTADGRLDRSFGNGGVVTTGFGQDGAAAAVVRRLADGRLLVAGTSRLASTGESVVAVARYLPDGRLDRSFSGDGRLLRSFGGPGVDYHEVSGLVVNPAGSGFVLAGGHVQSGDPAGWNVLLAAFTGRGRLDTSWGRMDGWVEKDVTPDDAVRGLVRLADGSFVVGGHGSFGTADYDAMLLRFGRQGVLDRSWGGGDGVVHRDAGTSSEYWSGLARTPAGLVMVGQVGSDAAVRRFLVSGASDRTFSGDGLAVTPFPGGVSDLLDVVVQPDGRLVAAGLGPASPTRQGIALERLLP